MHCTADPDDNLKRAAQFVRDAARQGVRVALPPQLQLSGAYEPDILGASPDVSTSSA